MSIQFHCDNCGRPIEVGDHFEGKHGHCKHCGHAIIIPEHAAASTAGEAIRLRPVEEDEPAGSHDRLLESGPALGVRHAEAEPKAAPKSISDPDARPHRPDDDYGVKPATVREAHGSAGPPPFWVNIPTLTARSLSHLLRTLRDWGYLVSLASLVVALLGFTFKSKGALHVGVAVAIAANIEMLVVGVAYLLTLPFKESLHHGLANLFPPYAIYYWWSRWPRMRTPVRKTVGAFLPIALAGLAYFLYEDGAAIEHKIAEEIPVLERKIEGEVEKIEGKSAKSIEGKIDRVIDGSDGGCPQ